MALPSALKGPWNPFRITGTQMPPALLLMCKIMATAVLATRHFTILPDPFLPFIPGLDEFLPPMVFKRTLQTLAVITAVGLLLNRWIRANALLLGACLLIGVLSSKAYYGNNKTFVGLALVLAGLSDLDRPPYLLRWQFALVYFGAALNKLLDPDWQSGLFFHHWAGNRLYHPAYLAVADWFAPLVVAKIFCWGTIITEFAICAGVLLKRFTPTALWLNAAFQLGLLEFTGSTFTLFFYGMQAIALAFVVWPESITVFHRGEPGERPLLWRWLDADRIQQWRSADSFSVNDVARTYTGVFGCCRLLLFSPAFWLIAVVLLAAPVPSAQLWRRLFAAALAVVAILAFWSQSKSPTPDADVESAPL